MSNTLMNLIRYGQMNPALSPQQQAVINDPYTQAAVAALTVPTTAAPMDHTDPYMQPALTQPTTNPTPRLDIGEVPLREAAAAKTDQQRKMLPFSLTRPTAPNNKIDLYEGAIRVGGEMVKGAQQGGLQSIGAGTGMYGKIMDYNRAQEMSQYKTEMDSYNKGLKALLDAQKKGKGGAGNPTAMLGSIVVNDAINRALPKIDNFSTGFLGTVISQIPGTDAKDLTRLLDAVKANAGFDKLQDMRDNSPTGGALGQVSNTELGFLQSVFGNLDQDQTPQQLRYNRGCSSMCTIHSSTASVSITTSHQPVQRRHQ